MTRKLYYEDSHLSCFESRVIGCRETEKGIEFFAVFWYNNQTYEHFCGGDESIDLQRENIECYRYPGQSGDGGMLYFQRSAGV